MASFGDWLRGLFVFLGPAGVFVALFLIFVVDAAIFPTLPELAIVLSYAYRDVNWDPRVWAGILLGMAVAGEVVGNTLMYLWVRKLLVDRGRMPKAIEKAMHRWTQFLVVPDERIILVNRIAPVLPFVGAFIATLHWSYARSLTYIVIGAAAKYSFLLALVGLLGLVYSQDTATLITVAAVIVTLGISLTASGIYRRRMTAPPR
jgi:hypothetical protein